MGVSKIGFRFELLGPSDFSPGAARARERVGGVGGGGDKGDVGLPAGFGSPHAVVVWEGVPPGCVWSREGALQPAHAGGGGGGGWLNHSASRMKNHNRPQPPRARWLCNGTLMGRSMACDVAVVGTHASVQWLNFLQGAGAQIREDDGGDDEGAAVGTAR